jgi:hypothetical protein
MFLLFHWAEQKRINDFYKPGSQGDGSFFGITDDFKGTENGYPGAHRREHLLEQLVLGCVLG